MTIEFERTHLERLRLAADVILSEPDDIGDALEAELTLFKDRLDRALLGSGKSAKGSAAGERLKLGDGGVEDA
jgi:hypothetical protein